MAIINCNATQQQFGRIVTQQTWNTARGEGTESARVKIRKNFFTTFKNPFLGTMKWIMYSWNVKNCWWKLYGVRKTSEIIRYTYLYMRGRNLYTHMGTHFSLGSANSSSSAFSSGVGAGCWDWWCFEVILIPPALTTKILKTKYMIISEF